jgi:hypothetical protein
MRLQAGQPAPDFLRPDIGGNNDSPERLRRLCRANGSGADPARNYLNGHQTGRMEIDARIRSCTTNSKTVLYQ